LGGSTVGENGLWLGQVADYTMYILYFRYDLNAGNGWPSHYLLFYQTVWQLRKKMKKKYLFNLQVFWRSSAGEEEDFFFAVHQYYCHLCLAFTYSHI
jgi:hypothetical protein